MALQPQQVQQAQPAQPAQPPWRMHPYYQDPNKEFRRNYDLKEELGKGGFGTVRRCIFKGITTPAQPAVPAQGGQPEQPEQPAQHLPRMELAAKVNNTPEKRQSCIDEANLCIELSVQLHPANVAHNNPSPYIVNIFDTIHEGDIVYNMFEMANGGDLSQEIIKNEFFSPDDAALAIYQILQGVNHIHQRGIIHRDLKPANILLKSKPRSNEDAQNRYRLYKVADFGLSCQRTRQQHGQHHVYIESRHGICGTPGYQPAEVIDDQPYDIGFDIFSCGVILYEMLAGYQPFWEDDSAVRDDRIRQNNYDFPNPEWSNTQTVDFTDARDMIQRMLQLKTNRANFAQLSTLPFYLTGANLNNNQVGPFAPNYQQLFNQNRAAKITLLNQYRQQHGIAQPQQQIVAQPQGGIPPPPPAPPLPPPQP